MPAIKTRARRRLLVSLALGAFTGCVALSACGRPGVAPPLEPTASRVATLATVAPPVQQAVATRATTPTLEPTPVVVKAPTLVKPAPTAVPTSAPPAVPAAFVAPTSPP